MFVTTETHDQRRPPLLYARFQTSNTARLSYAKAASLRTRQVLNVAKINFEKVGFDLPGTSHLLGALIRTQELGANLPFVNLYVCSAWRLGIEAEII